MKTNPAVAELKTEIDEFIGRLTKYNINSGITDRLSEVRDDLGNQASEWYYMDLYTILNPSLLLDQVRDSQRKKSQWLGPVEVLRNILVLFPILLTWYALSKASASYSQAISANSALSNLPFLLQWEQGFGGALPVWLSFSQVALLDAIILIVIITATLFVHYYNNIQFEYAEREAIQLVAELNNLLWRINKILVKKTDVSALSQTLLDDIKGFVGSFQQQGEDFHDLLSAEQERMQKLNEFRLQELQEFDVVSKAFLNSASQMTDFAKNNNQSIHDFQSVVSVLSAEIHAIPKSQGSLDRTLKSLDGHLGGFESVMQDLIHTLDAKLTDIGYSTQVELSNLARVSGDMGDSVKKVSENQKDLIEIISKEKTTDNELIDQTRETAIQMKSVGEKLEELSKNYEMLSKQTIDMSADTSKVLTTLNDNIKYFTDVLGPVDNNYKQSLLSIGEISSRMEKVYLEINLTRNELTTAYTNYQSATQAFQKSMQFIMDTLNAKQKAQGLGSDAVGSDADLTNLVKELQSLNTALRKNRLFNFLGNK